MSNIRPPQYGVKKDELTLTSQDPASVLYGVTSDNKFIPVKITDDGSLVIGTSLTLDTSDIQIGAVEIKNYDTDDRAYISPNHEVLAQARLYDAAGTALTSTGGALDVNITNALTLTIDEATSDILVYGFDGSVNKKIKTDAAGELQIDILSSALPTGASTEATLATRATEATLSGFRTDFNAVDFATEITLASIDSTLSSQLDVLLSTRSSESTLSGFRTDFNAVDFSTETTLLAVKTDLDQFSFTGGSVDSNITNSTLAVTQSGVWSVGRTWTLASGTDSVNAVQSGAWTVTSNIGTTGGLALDATLTNNTQKSQIVNSSGTSVDVLTLSTTPTGSENGLVAHAVIYGHTTGGGGGYVEVKVNPSGTLTVDASGSSVSASQSGTWNINNISGTISLPTGASTEATLAAVKTQTDKLTFASTRLLVDGSGVTQPISAVSLPLPTGASTSANQTNGSQKSQIVDGSGNVIGSTSNALDVNIKSGVTLEVNLDNANDDVLVYGNDGSTNRAIKTDASGDVLTDPIDKVAREIGRISASDSVIISESFSTSVNTYGNARPVNGDMNVRHYKTKKIYVKNTSAFNGRLEIFGSVDDGANFDVTIVPDQGVNAGVTSVTDLTDAVTHLQIQVRSQNNGQTTTWVSKAYALGV